MVVSTSAVYVQMCAICKIPVWYGFCNFFCLADIEPVLVTYLFISLKNSGLLPVRQVKIKNEIDFDPRYAVCF